MRRRWFVIFTIFSGFVAFVFFDPTRTVLGWISGELFFENRPTSYWVRSLASDDPAVKNRAIESLRLGRDNSIPMLLTILSQSRQTVVVVESIHLITEIGNQEEKTIESLWPILQSEDSYARAAAMKYMNQLERIPEKGIPIFIGLLNGPQRLQAARALSKYRAQASPAIPRLIELLDDSDIDVRWNAARTLGKIGPDSKVAIPKLISQLDDSNNIIREHAAEALGDIGPDAAVAVPHLGKLLSVNHDMIRRDAVRALGRIGAAAKGELPKVLELTKDLNPLVREAALKTARILDPTIQLEPISKDKK